MSAASRVAKNGRFGWQKNQLTKWQKSIAI
nr:MAG TPA: hypothetical protein [Caudoviricetes sp.]